MNELWLTTIPIKNESPDTIYEKLKEPVELGRSQARIHRIIIPDLVVGTLDTLMLLAEDLVKHCNQVEQILRKIERQYIEIAGSSKVSPLNVNNKPIEEFLRKFEWDFARYQHQNRPLNEIISQIQVSSSKADDELKKLASTYNEKQLAYSTLQRRKIINMSLSEFEDFLTIEEVARLDLINSDSLLTVTVAVPITIDSEFLRKYMTIGNDIASLGSIDFEGKGIIPGNDNHVFGIAGRDSRNSVKGSPVIPNSAKKIKEIGEYVLYTIDILKGHYEAGSYDDDGNFTNGVFHDYLKPLIQSFKENRYVLREFTFDPKRAGSLDHLMNNANQQVKSTYDTIINWCQAHFGEVYSAWIHLKIIRAFVESVLRYSLPVNILAVLVEPNMKKEKNVKIALTNAIAKIQPSLITKKFDINNEDEDDDDFETLPFVCHKFNIIGGLQFNDK